ncbi:KR domain-containing protein [Xylaria longipes]|nr:KR domain-containing protein [Xylaria longipes]
MPNECVPESNIFQSRDASFASDISKRTNGRGVDVILNSLVGDLLHESWNCIAKFGRFIEIGKRDLLDAGKLDMRVFLRNVTFTAVMRLSPEPTPPGLGTKRVVFLGRSGCNKPDAKKLVNTLENAGALVSIVRGYVTSPTDVKAAVEACRSAGPSIGGVVQAAMGLHEGLFSTMTNEAWHTSVQPKWRGSWNPHNELAGEDGLDFFLLLSSVLGSREQGIPSVSVRLGMISDVGYLHENPEIEALLLGKGIQPLNEDEFLKIIDLALASAAQRHSSNSLSSGHILTGLEPFGLKKLMSRGFEVDNGTMQDPRTTIISAGLMAEKESRKAIGHTTYNLGSGAPEWIKPIPPQLAEVLSAITEDGDQRRDVVLKLILKRFSDLFILAQDQIDDTKTLAQYGIA